MSAFARATGADRGFDFTGQMRRLCEDIVGRLPELVHVRMSEVAVAFSQTRKSCSHGLQASLTPMRFADGSLHTTRRRRRWTVQRLFDSAGREMLYILRFYLPRFLELELQEKLTTIFHELWHISPRFDGDLRRFEGRCYAHSHSQEDFDAHAEQLSQRWLALRPPGALYDLLRLDFQQLQQAHGRIFGTRIAVPKLIPADEARQDIAAA